MSFRFSSLFILSYVSVLRTDQPRNCVRDLERRKMRNSKVSKASLHHMIYFYSNISSMLAPSLAMGSHASAPNHYLLFSTAAPLLMDLTRSQECQYDKGLRTLCPIQHTESYLCVVTGVQYSTPRLWKGWCHKHDSKSGTFVSRESKEVSSPFTSVYSHSVFALNLFAVQWPIPTDFFFFLLGYFVW